MVLGTLQASSEIYQLTVDSKQAPFSNKNCVKFCLK